MTEDEDQTKSRTAEFDFSAFPANTLFHERRFGRERRKRLGEPGAAGPERKVDQAGQERRARKERRKRIDPTTFEKQYTDDELEFMNAMQRFKERTGKAFPSHGEVIRVAVSLGYRMPVAEEPPSIIDA